LIGVYGVIGYSVAQRTREIGIRVALGATHRDVVALVVRAGMGWSIVGVVLGLAGALGLSRLISGLLFGVTANDPATFIAIAVAMLGVALAATYVPARRAASVDPITALRTE
jgi:putative ABC transport system permease protein